MAENQTLEHNIEGESCDGQSTLPSKEAQQSKPRDGPATAFDADPMVSDIFNGKDGDYFGLVLVTNWPPLPISAMEGPYQDFLGAVKSCFQDEDLIATQSNETTSTNSKVPLPAVYLYPTMHLHITVATFVPATKIVGTTDTNHSFSTKELRDAKRAEALDLVQAASKLPEWPTEPLQLVVDSAQIGKRAGILLWKDLSGGLEAMRNCLRKASTNSSTPIIPGIIHSTFLRFANVPQTPGEKVQEAFQSKIQGRLGKDFFHDTGSSTKPLVLRANTVKLACESTPYMHIPKDDEHVLWTTELTSEMICFS